MRDYPTLYLDTNFHDIHKKKNNKANKTKRKENKHQRIKKIR